MRLYMCGRWCCRGDCAHLRPARALGIGAALHDTDMFLHLGGRRERVRDEMSLGDRRPARNIGDRLERLHIKMASRAQLFILVDLPASSLAACTSVGEVDCFPPLQSGWLANFSQAAEIPENDPISDYLLIQNDESAFVVAGGGQKVALNGTLS